MKKNLLSKNIHQWLLLLVCFVGTLPSWAEDYTRDGIIYDINTSRQINRTIGITPVDKGSPIFCIGIEAILEINNITTSSEV